MIHIFRSDEYILPGSRVNCIGKREYMQQSVEVITSFKWEGRINPRSARSKILNWRRVYNWKLIRTNGVKFIGGISAVSKFNYFFEQQSAIRERVNCPYLRTVYFRRSIGDFRRLNLNVIVIIGLAMNLWEGQKIRPLVLNNSRREVRKNRLAESVMA